jgi:hypothetical protein
VKSNNIQKLENELVGKTITAVRGKGGHGLILTITMSDGTWLDVATYDDGEKRPVDEFYIGLNGEEL